MGFAKQAAEQVTSAMEAYDINRAHSLLADNFTFHDPNSPMGPMTADEWLGASESLHRAFPDFNYNFEIDGEDGNQAWVSSRMEGTHTGDWDLSAMGMGVIPATGRKVSTGKSTTRGIVNNQGKVASIEVVEQDDNAGMMAILRQIGVELG